MWITVLTQVNPTWDIFDLYDHLHMLVATEYALTTEGL